jgi:metallo-beta-lactamase family protein
MADAAASSTICNNLPRANATVLFVGYRARTFGRSSSAAPRPCIHNEEVPVRARVRSMGNYSAHADHTELMLITARLRRTVRSS